jgi:membrane associated rhomboid family serine protease
MQRRVLSSNWFSDAWRYNPATVVIVIAWAAVFLLHLGAPPLVEQLAFNGNSLTNLVIGFFTNPLVVRDPLSLVLNGYMLWVFGGSLERSWMTRPYLLFLLATNAITLIMWELGCLLLAGGVRPLDGGAWMMLANVVVAWALLNPLETILLGFFLPLQARWVAWLTVGLLYFNIAQRGYLLAIFGLGGVAAVALYLWYRRRWGWIPRRRDTPARRPLRLRAANPFAALLRPFTEWQRRRRVAHLQKTFRFSDDEPKQR